MPADLVWVGGRIQLPGATIDPACGSQYEARSFKLRRWQNFINFISVPGRHSLIWRRLLIIGEASVAQLHEILQLAFDWSSEHLRRFRFRVRGRDYWSPQFGGIAFDEDTRQVPLSRFFRLHDGERFLYEYDFTVGWGLDVPLEQVLPWDAKCSVFVCTGPYRRLATGL